MEYVIVDQIGKGAGSDVFLVRRNNTDLYFAMKNRDLTYFLLKYLYLIYLGLHFDLISRSNLMKVYSIISFEILILLMNYCLLYLFYFHWH